MTNSDTYSLQELGWSPAFLRQLEIDEIGALTPARVTAVHRATLTTLGETGPRELILRPGLSTGDIAVGDWVLVEPDGIHVARVLERESLIHRRAAGDEPRDQLIAANLDTLFITSSLNADFNVARLERYLVLAHAGGVNPVIVLTKADLCDDPDPYLDQLREAAPTVPVITLDARDTDAAAKLTDWAGAGQTVAFVGSSGVGKSTLAVAMTGDTIETRGVREDDAKGRHTTTARSFHKVATGGWLIDTPGMRALRLMGVGEGIDAVFEDLAELATDCKFSDCAHDAEPGCAVKAAIAEGKVSIERVGRWRKLLAEDARNAETIAAAHSRDRAFGRMVKRAKNDKAGRKKS